MGDRAVLPLGQADPQDPPLSRHQRERRAHPDRRRADRLSAAAPGPGRANRGDQPARLRPPGSPQPDASPTARSPARSRNANRLQPRSNGAPMEPRVNRTAVASAQASRREIPMSIILVTTSVRLITLIEASGSAAATTSQPGSALISASSAEASRTTSVLCSFGPAVENQAFRQQFALSIVSAHQRLHALDAMIEAGNAQLIIFHPDHHLIAHFQAKFPPLRSGDHQTASRPDLRSRAAHSKTSQLRHILLDMADCLHRSIFWKNGVVYQAWQDLARCDPRYG